MNQGIYGKYNVEVLKQDGESYYPFGSGYQNNIILDDFFEKVLSGWKHSPQAWMQTCITNTGSNPAARQDTTGTFGVPNDTTWASTVFLTGLNTGENRIFMSRDFIFDTVSGEKTYREAMVGLFYKNNSNQSASIQSDIALSHFVFPSNIVLSSGQRLKISYNLNLIVDYLSPTGLPFTLSGNGYNFNGRIRLMSNDLGIFNSVTSTNTRFSEDTVTGFNETIVITKPINSNSNSYTRSQSPSNLYSSCLLAGLKPFYGSNNNIGFYNTSFTPSTYPNRFNGAAIVGSAATLTSSNLQVNESGASIDVDYYFPPLSTNRNVNGILLNNHSAPSSSQYGTVYLAFDSAQTILANDPISMRINWSFKRL